LNPLKAYLSKESEYFIRYFIQETSIFWFFVKQLYLHMTTPDLPKTIHQGRNVKRIREILGIKQESLAAELGEDWTQKKISLLETKETIEPELLEQVAKALKVPVEAIKNFNEDAAIFNIQHNYDNASNNSNYSYQCNFNPIDKIVQLYDEKIELYERMLKEKDGIIEKIRKEERNITQIKGRKGKKSGKN